MSPRVAIAHDYLTQRGGAERVVLSMMRAFPDAAVHTSLFDPGATYPELATSGRVRALPLDRITFLRRHHRAALPFLAPAFARHRVEADVVVCNSSGWAHGVRATGAKVVYCQAPARWLYQREPYLAGAGVLTRAGLALLAPWLTRVDRRAAASAARYLVNSTWTAALVRKVYGIDAEVLAPPVTVDVAAPAEPVPGIEPGYLLCVSRLLGYKRVDAIVEACARLPAERLVVVGDGPARAELAARAPANVHLLGSVGDAQLRWLYAGAAGLVAAAHEDFGLTPLEAAAFGRPTAAWRGGGYLDTVVEDETGVLFDTPDPAGIADALVRLRARAWPEDRLRAHAARFGEDRFVARLRAVVDEAAARDS